MKTERALLGVAIFGLIVTSVGIGVGVAALIETSQSTGVSSATIRTVVATEAQARWAFWQFVVSIVGSAGLAITLLFNARAIELASQANANARELTEISSRCYLNLENAAVRFDEMGTIYATLYVANTGATPAEFFEWFARFTVSTPNNAGIPVVTTDREPPIEIGPPNATIAPGPPAVLGPLLLGALSDKELEALRDRKRGIMISLEVETAWKDVFGYSWERSFARVLTIAGHMIHIDHPSAQAHARVEGVRRGRTG